MDLSNLLSKIKAKWEVRAKVWRCLCMVWSLNCSKSCRELCETTFYSSHCEAIWTTSGLTF